MKRLMCLLALLLVCFVWPDIRFGSALSTANGDSVFGGTCYYATTCSCGNGIPSSSQSCATVGCDSDDKCRVQSPFWVTSYNNTHYECTTTSRPFGVSSGREGETGKYPKTVCSTDHFCQSDCIVQNGKTTCLTSSSVPHSKHDNNVPDQNKASCAATSE